MTTVEKTIVGVGVTAIALMLMKHYQDTHKKNSSFVDDELSSASGKAKDNTFTITKGEATANYKPSAWTKVSGKWVWVNAKGDLVF